MFESDDQLLTKRSQAPKHARSDIRYWQEAVFQRVRKRKGQKQRGKLFSVQLQFGGRREEFNLGTANKAQAASRAREIFEQLKVNGWAATLSKFKPQSAGTGPAQIGVRTVGEFVHAIEATTPSANRTITEYIRRFRKIVADIFELDGDNSKFDYRAGGREKWLKKIDAVELETLTPALIQAWRIGYLNKSAKSPAAQRAAKIAVNSTLRQARSLFSPKRLDYVQLPEGFRSPFDGLKLEARQSMRYRGSFDVPKLIADARGELAQADPELFKALLLALMAGLRRGEIDRLEWNAFDWQNLILHVQITEHLAVKSQDSIGDVDLDPEVAAIFKEFYTQRTGTFVIESDLSAKAGATYLNYRCRPIFKALAAWLRKHGVPGLRPLHTLRKEFGSQICDRHGIYAASRALRHADVSITSMHYLDKRSRATTGLGGLLAS